MMVLKGSRRLSIGGDTVPESVASYLAFFPKADRGSVEAHIQTVAAGLDLEEVINQFLMAQGSGLTLPRFSLLRCLFLSDQRGIPLSELAAKLHVTSGNITQIVDVLVRDGLVKRVASEKDRRVIEAHLTAKAVTLCSSLVPAVVDLMHSSTESLTSEERIELARLLAKLRGALREPEPTTTNAPTKT